MRHQHHRGDGEEAAEDVGSPAAPQREAGERDEQERRHGDRTGSPEHRGREPVARVGEDVELAGVLPKRALQLVDGGRVRARVADDREQPREIDRRGDDQRRQRCGDPPRFAPLDERANDEEACEREPEEDRVRRVDDGEHEPRRGDRREQAAARRLDVGERERQRGGQQDLARGRCRQAERGVGAAVVGRECGHGDRAQDDGDGRADPPEERPACLVRDQQRHRRQHRRLVQHDLGGIEEADPRDEGEEAVPERERVAGMEPPVRELVDGPERERAERIQLLHAREMEEPVAADVPGDVPEQEAEHRARCEDPAAPRDPLRPRGTEREPDRDEACGEHERERQ